MKKVLHRSFKPAKCKTALQMAISRLKILKNKKDTQIKQLRRELAHLLESGQTQTALIRVEHVVREEKTVAAYELVGIYCELLVARLGVIESQKTCPSDLKEAVASVLYASQRLSDAAELADVVKQFSAKYGKDFVSAAIVLQPDSGVSRLLVEKLSVKAPDGSTKIKILTEIATEHNVNWESESLGESDPKETESLRGATSSRSESRINSDSSRIPINQPPDVQVPATVNMSHNSYASDGRSSSHTASIDFNIGKAADDYHHEPRPPNPSYGESSPWETEFVDATTAARAAAESAERASFAAHAAAELSYKERMMHHSTEPQNLSSYDCSRDEPSHRRTSSSSTQSGGFAKEDILRSSSRQKYQSTTRTESSDKTVGELSENASWRRGHSRDNSLEMRPNDSVGKTGREKEQPSMDDINLSSSEHVLLKNQSSRASFHSQSSNFSDDKDVTASDHIDSPSILEKNRLQSTVKDTESPSHGHDDVVDPAFDVYRSVYDKPKFDIEEPEQGLGFSFLGSSSNKTPDHMPTETNSWSFKGYKSVGQASSASTSQVLEKEKPSSPLFDYGPTNLSASPHESEPCAKFDDYDRDSESEEENLRNKGTLSGGVEEKQKLTSHKSPMSEDPDDLGRYFFPSDTEDDSMPQEESDAETPTGPRFGPLAGGLNIERTLPPYGMSPPRDKTLSKSVKEHVETEIDPARSSSSSIKKDLTHKARNHDKGPSSIPPDSSSSDDETEMELLKKVSIRKQDKRTESRTQPAHLHSRVTLEDSDDKIPRSREQRTHKTTPASASYFHSVSSDDEDDEKKFHRDASGIETKPFISISRRTKGQERRSSLITAKTDKVSEDQESLPKLIHEAKPLPKQQGSTSSSSFPKTKKPSHDQESSPKLAKQQGPESPPKLDPKAKLLAKLENSASSSSSLPNTVTSPDLETPARQKASHVHPKLPDYDDIFAKLGARRQ